MRGDGASDGPVRMPGSSLRRRPRRQCAILRHFVDALGNYACGQYLPGRSLKWSYVFILNKRSC
jgi:hypothetical protein